LPIGPAARRFSDAAAAPLPRAWQRRYLGAREESNMAIKQLNPYLNFNGTAAKAIKLYESALGATAEVMPWTSAPGAPSGPEYKDRVMHARLQIGQGVLMLSDSQPNAPVPAGGNMHVTLDFDDPADMARRFEALSAGGKITMPLQDTFWGAKFGMLTDAFGINWMFNCEQRKG
jgi:PhnB protein